MREEPRTREMGGMTGNAHFEFTDRDFQFVARFIGERAGIVLGEGKRELVYGRLIRRLRALGLRRFGDYCALLEDDAHEEVEHFINALTTNLTSFFREPHHFEHLATNLLPALLRQRGDKRLRVWSAGCSTGEEPYSIAMVLAEVMPPSWDWKVLATDLDSNVVRTAAAGIYGIERVKGMDRVRLRRFFQRGGGTREGLVRVRGELRERVRFRRLNLLEPWPLRAPVDIIFCRNVVIYFDKPTQRSLFERYADQLVAEGHLFVGHSESLFKVCDRFRPLGGTIYQKVR